MPTTPPGDTAPRGAENMREQLAALAHEQWTGWMRYMVSRCEKLQSGPYAGGLVIPQEWRERWRRQMDTPYAELSEAEKNSDREEADRVLALLASPASPVQAEPTHGPMPRLGIDGYDDSGVDDLSPEERAVQAEPPDKALKARAQLTEIRKYFGDEIVKQEDGTTLLPWLVRLMDVEPIVAELESEVAALREALTDIVKCECTFRIDPLEHARSAVEHMRALAEAALARAEAPR